MTRIISIADDKEPEIVEGLQLEIPIKTVTTAEEGTTVEETRLEVFDCVPNVQGSALANYFVSTSDPATSVRGVMTFLESAIADHDLARFREITAAKDTYVSFPKLNRTCRALVEEYSGRQFPTLRSPGSSTGQTSTTPGSTVRQLPGASTRTGSRARASSG